MFLKYLTIQRTIVYSLVIFFANRSWNYIDRLNESPDGLNEHSAPLIPLIITLSLFSFFLGFIISLEISVKQKKK
jgi:hypothetical protein